MKIFPYLFKFSFCTKRMLSLIPVNDGLVFHTDLKTMVSNFSGEIDPLIEQVENIQDSISVGWHSDVYLGKRSTYKHHIKDLNFCIPWKRKQFGMSIIIAHALPNHLLNKHWTNLDLLQTNGTIADIKKQVKDMVDVGSTYDKYR